MNALTSLPSCTRRSPGQTEPVEGAGAASHFVHQHQASGVSRCAGCWRSSVISTMKVERPEARSSRADASEDAIDGARRWQRRARNCRWASRAITVSAAYRSICRPCFPVMSSIRRCSFSAVLLAMKGCSSTCSHHQVTARSPRTPARRRTAAGTGAGCRRARPDWPACPVRSPPRRYPAAAPVAG